MTASQRGQSLDLHGSVRHLAPRSYSKQLQRNVIGDGGEAIFKGRIRLPAVAAGSVSSQLCRSIVMGEKPRVVMMPVLEVGSDDVDCSHGAVAGDVDENTMFYLSARGLDRAVSR